MGLNSVLEIGKSGLGIYQTAIEVTGQNIANVNTQGYSRQQIIMETAPPVPSNGFPIGTGARIASVQRSYDGLLQQQLVTAQSTEGNDTTRSNVLQQIEPAFNEVANDGLGSAISNFFGAWQDLTLNPAGSTERQTLLSRAQIMIDNFNSINTTLTNTIIAQDTSLIPLTADISDKLKNIAQLNGQISAAQGVGGDTNMLKDQRDLLLQNLSTDLGINYAEQSDGSISVTLADGGQALVTGSKYATMFTADSTATEILNSIAKLNGQISAVKAVNGNTTTLTGEQDLLLQKLNNITKNPGWITYPRLSDDTVNVTLTDGGRALVTGSTMFTANSAVTGKDIYLTYVGNPPSEATVVNGKIITPTVGGANNKLGVLGGTLALRNTIIPGYLKQVDELANKIGSKVNDLHLNGYGLNGTLTPNPNYFFTVTPTPATGTPVTTFNASTISLKISDANNIAAASSASTPGDNSNALAIAQLQNTLLSFNNGSATINSYYDSLVSNIGLDVQSAKNTVTQDKAFTQQLSALRESNSGVSLDEELTNLLKYQRSYQASAKLLTTASDMMDTVLGLIR